MHGPRIDEILQSDGNSHLYDGLGSTRSLTDANGQTVASATYDVFGALRSSTGAPNNDFLYTGRQLDRETGLYYYRNRYYSPTVGRFITKDPVGLRGGINVYLYTENDPINYIDSDGLLRLPAGVKKGIQVIVTTAGIISGITFPSDGSPVLGTGQAKGGREKPAITSNIPNPDKKNKKPKKKERAGDNKCSLIPPFVNEPPISNIPSPPIPNNANGIPANVVFV